MTDQPAAAERPSDEALLARFHNARSRPPASDLLGFAVIAVDQAAMSVEAQFTARPDFTNPAGHVQGGFLTAMLDETMSVAGVVASGMTAFLPTLEMKTCFLRPVRPGPVRCVGRVVKWGRAIAFLQGELFDADGRLAATATSTAMPQPFKSVRPSPGSGP